jgi:ATP:corrinoid adenosyltransferase
MTPKSNMPDMTSVVITGRRMKSSGMLMAANLKKIRHRRSF